MSFPPQISKKTREGCGCPKFPAGKVFQQISMLLENDSPIFRQRKVLSLPRFGQFPARKTAAGKLAAPAGTLLDFSSETATAFLSSSEINKRTHENSIKLSSAFAKRGACKRGLRKLHIGHHQLHSNYIPETWVTMTVIDSNAYSARSSRNKTAGPKCASCMNHV